jgi:hypothetical protein
VKTAKSEKPIVWFNPENDTIEEVTVASSNVKVAARLKTAGYDLDENYWVDATYNPSKFGRICTFVNVPLGKAGDFKKIAALSDEEWANRGLEDGKAGKSKQMSADQWVNRTEEGKSYNHKDFKKGEEWVNRTEEKGKANPYGNVNTIMISGSKNEKNDEAVRKAVSENDTLKKIEELEKLL